MIGAAPITAATPGLPRWRGLPGASGQEPASPPAATDAGRTGEAVAGAIADSDHQTQQLILGNAADLQWSYELQQALLAFQSGDFPAAASELAPLADAGSPIATYDLDLIHDLDLDAGTGMPSAPAIAGAKTASAFPVHDRRGLVI